MKYIKMSLILLTALIALKPCFADPIPVPPSPTHVVFIQLTAPVLINYLWNFVIIGAILNSFEIKVKSRRFFLFVLVLTLTGLIIDVATFFLRADNFLGWILVAGISLFVLSFSLTKLFYKLSRQKCIISGLVYAVASHPIIGITFIVPILARFSLVPPL